MDGNTTFGTLAGIAIRHGLTAAAGTLVAQGALQGSSTEAFVGIAVGFVGFGLSWLKNHTTNKALKNALDGVQF